MKQQEPAGNNDKITNDRQKPAEYVTIDPRARIFMISVRQALIMLIGALEDYLGIERSIVPRHKRRIDSDASKV